jgi:GNAT superfamily N-acetyltransferase
MEYEIKELGTTLESINHYTSLLKQVFPGTQKYTTEYLTWQYCNNPAGKAIGFDAYYNNEIVAHYATIPVQYTLDGNIVKGLLSLNTATDKNHQGKGLFSILANKTYDSAKELGFAFVIGVANQNSTHGFVKKFGFQFIKQLDVKIGFGNVSDIKTANHFKLSSTIDETFVKWRLANPSNTYSKANASILAKTEKPFLKAQIFSKLPFNISIKSNWFHFTIFIGLLNNKKINGVFVNLPNKLRRSPLNLIFKPLQDTGLLLKEGEILFDLKDFDSY